LALHYCALQENKTDDFNLLIQRIKTFIRLSGESLKPERIRGAGAVIQDLIRGPHGRVETFLTASFTKESGGIN